MNRIEKFWKAFGDELHSERGEFRWTRSLRGVHQMMPEDSYWLGNGRHQALADDLQPLIPSEGRVKNPRKNKHLEHLRVVSNAYYDLYNNGGGNRPAQIYTYAGKRGVNQRYVHMALEFYLDFVILSAHAEQFGLDREVRYVA